MGASITMAKGAADAGSCPAFAVIGDLTFSHTGMTGLLVVVNANVPIKVYHPRQPDDRHDRRDRITRDRITWRKSWSG